MLFFFSLFSSSIPYTLALACTKCTLLDLDDLFPYICPGTYTGDGDDNRYYSSIPLCDSIQYPDRIDCKYSQPTNFGEHCVAPICSNRDGDGDSERWAWNCGAYNTDGAGTCSVVEILDNCGYGCDANGLFCAAAPTSYACSGTEPIYSSLTSPQSASGIVKGPSSSTTQLSWEYNTAASTTTPCKWKCDGNNNYCNIKDKVASNSDYCAKTYTGLDCSAKPANTDWNDATDPGKYTSTCSSGSWSSAPSTAYSTTAGDCKFICSSTYPVWVDPSCKASCSGAVPTVTGGSIIGPGYYGPGDTTTWTYSATATTGTPCKWRCDTANGWVQSGSTCLAECSGSTPCGSPDSCTAQNACGGCGALTGGTPGTSCDGADTDLCQEGTWNCNAAKTATTCSDNTGDIIEICDGIDNDCDGPVDEGVTNACGGCGTLTGGTPNTACDGADTDLCAEGTWNCNAAKTATTCSDTTGSTTEVCDGVDNNCDGTNNENPGTICGSGMTCSSGTCVSTCKKSGDCTGTICADYYCSNGNVCEDGRKWDGSSCRSATYCTPDCDPFVSSCVNNAYCGSGIACCPVTYGATSTVDCVGIQTYT